jgi:hypothetical protein
MYNICLILNLKHRSIAPICAKNGLWVDRVHIEGCFTHWFYTVNRDDEMIIQAHFGHKKTIVESSFLFLNNYFILTNMCKYIKITKIQTVSNQSKIVPLQAIRQTNTIDVD